MFPRVKGDDHLSIHGLAWCVAAQAAS
eukprot:COSAG01_NODE_82485_length_104_cov_255.000000_1_plen_26_part_10